MVVVNADATTHAAIEALLSELETWALRDCRIELHLLDSAALATHVGVLTSAETQALLKSEFVRSTQVIRGRFGRPASIEMISRQAFLMNFDIEVAQFASATDPQVSVLQEGLLGGVLLEERTGGMLTMRMWGRWCEATQPMESIVVGLHGERMHVPVVDAQLFVASADLRSGESIVLGGTEMPMSLLLRVRCDVADATEPQLLKRVDLADAMDHPHFRGPLRAIQPSPSFGWNEIFTSPDVWKELASPLDPREVVHDAGVRVELPHAVLGKQLLVRATDEELEAVRESFAGYIPAPVETYVVELRKGSVLLDRLHDLENAAADELVELLPGKTTGVVRGGDSLVLVGGTQRTYVKDYEIEVAQGVHIAGPVIDDIFGGLAVWACVLPSAEGFVELQHEVRHTQILDVGTPLIEAEPETEFPGLSFPRVAARDSWGDQPIRLGEWVQLGASSTGSGTVELLYARVRRIDR